MSLMPCPAAVNAHRYPQQTAVSWAGRSVAWEALNNYIHSTSRYLKEISVRANARVIVVQEESPAYIIVLLALWRIKAVACPVPWQVPLQQIEKVQELVQPDRVIGARKAKKTWGAGSRWTDIEQVVAYGYNDSFLGSETSLDPKIDMDSQALLRVTLDQKDLAAQTVTHARLKDDPGHLAGLFHSLETGEALIF